MKPEDTDQIAKAREQRACKFWQEWLNTQEGGASLFLATSEPGKTLFPFAAAFAASERQAVIEDCAKVLENGANQWDANAKTAARNGDSAGGMIGITVASALRKIVAAIRSME